MTVLNVSASKESDLMQAGDQVNCPGCGSLNLSSRDTLALW